MMINLHGLWVHFHFIFKVEEGLVSQGLIAHTLRENCPDTEFFLVHIVPHWDRIRRDAPYLSVFSPNAGK